VRAAPSISSPLSAGFADAFDTIAITRPRRRISSKNQLESSMIDKEATKAKYIAERDKRLRADGTAQYHRLAGEAVADPYVPVEPREPKTDHVTFAFVGGGFAGLLTSARLVEAGVKDVRIIDKAGDFGGAWYWNRYPGAQCDTASMVYMPLLEETGHRPTEKYAHAPEIREQCQRIGRQYGLYDLALFHTEVTGLTWDEARSVWRIETDRGDSFTAQFIGLGTGPLHVAKLPGIPGVESFTGHSFHTSRWDYDYTGGDPTGTPLSKLADKRVAIIGTGATGIQCVPHLAKTCGQLFVCQRTPSSVDVRANAPIQPEWFAGIATPGWQKRWLENFTENQAGGFAATEDLVQDGWTDMWRRVRGRIENIPPEARSLPAIAAALEDSDFEKMDEIRARVDTLVSDATAAQGLKAWYRQLCKRPCFHDAYLQAFNSPNVTLLDTDGKGVERITETGVVVAGVEYPVDCIIYASGFEMGSPYAERAGFDLVGRDGLTLSAAWSDGMRSLHGVYVRGFPNAFFVQATQGAALISNVPHNYTEAGASIALVVAETLKRDASRVEVTQDGQDKWVEILLTPGLRSMLSLPDCTPGYYNNEGQPLGPAARYAVGYPQGPAAYFRYLDGWRKSGAFEGLAFESPAAS
jgi:cation diffusion facilitator CzcD-associated flavoprotein CzcO